MTRFDDLEQQRLAKVEAMRARGTDPYPVSFERTHTAGQLHALYDGIEPGASTGARAAAAGRLMLHRDSGKLAFGVLRDGTGEIQLFCSMDALGEPGLEDFKALDLGDWVAAEGEVIKTRRGELSVRAERVVLLAKAIRPLPEKWHGLRDVELRFRQRYLDLLVTPEARRVAEVRARAVDRIRRYMVDAGYLEVETPMLQVQPGGALARPFVTHMNALDLDLYLRIAPELYLKRLIVAGFERVFEVNRNFRNEGLSPRHNPEFTMLEAYQALGDYHTMMDLMEGLVSTVAEDVLGTTDVTYREQKISLAPPFRRARLVDLVSEAVGQPLDLDMPVDEARGLARDRGLEPEDGWSVGKIIVELYEKLVEPRIFQPTFVMDFPRDVQPLARPHRDDPRWVEQFDLTIGGIEVGPAYSELNDPIDQRERFEAQMRARAAGDEEAMSLDEDFLRALEHGMPPTGGMGFGVDRFVMILTDAPSLRETMLFPLMRPEA